MSAITNVTAIAPTKSRSSIKRAMIVTRRELRDMLRDWRMIAPVAVLVILLPVLLAAILSGNKSFLIERIGFEAFNDRLLPFTMLAIGFLPMSFCLVIALEAFVGEKERNSLEALLSAPLTDFELFVGKYTAAVIPTILACTTASVIFSALMAFNGVPIPIDALLWFTFLGLNISKALVMVAAAVLVSTITTSVRAANILASFIILPMSLIVQLEAILLLFNNAHLLYFLLVGLIVIFILVMRSGIKLFNREEIVAREGDSISFKSIGRRFKTYFKRTPHEALANQQTGEKFTIWRLYRRDIPQIIGMNKLGMLALTICMVAAVIIGAWISTWPEIDQGVNELAARGAININGTNPVCATGSLENLSSPIIGRVSTSRIFINNVAAVLLGSLFSIFTLGILGIGVLMVSTGPIGGLGAILFKLGANPLPLLLGFVLPHGIIELPAVILGLSAGMSIGLSLLVPPKNLNIGMGFQLALVNYVKILALIVPLLLIAAIIEANITPAIGCWVTGGKI